ncbi:MAG: hypothetical protein CVU71_01925 [Deltaproteobacteria bacterium HGW-Deltaproteobacteria-6]|nr:MAG: hypothetical protein CVU71_01925 [Deltaproteobacteria bacterium HGW-Deltaproteobacteria-6]
MREWAVIIVSGICSLSSFYMSFLAFTLSDNGVFLFAAFGLFAGAFFIASVIRVLAAKSMLMKRINDKISGKPQPVSFVPHRFIMLALIITGIAIVAAIVIPIIFR